MLTKSKKTGEAVNPSQPTFDRVKSFLESKPACHNALKRLRKGVEIRVVIEGEEEGALYFDGSSPKLEKRPAQNPDVEFRLETEFVRVLENHPGEDMAQLGIDVVREIVAGTVHVGVCGSLWSVFRNGYLRIISEAGPEFTKYLASNGLNGLSKVKSVIKSLKK